ncbi:MAG: polyprenol monophosphomannose synthase [Lentisphaerae bacterium]|nr:polyprenol monophosphomannose synthase [Lentisphaerota bacterium]
MSVPLVVIPTYDERDNVGPISAAVLHVVPEAHLLFVDDNSPDGTGAVLDDLARGDDRIGVLHKAGKNGFAAAYISGFKWALEREYGPVIGMDADFSHDPAEIPALLEAAGSADLIIGSRYVDGIRITNWPLSRLLLSKMAATYVRLITGIPVADPTSGFRCYRREVLQAVNLDAILSNGYSFLVETAHTTWMLGFRIREIPITFVDRRSGYSKMTLNIFRESLWIVWKLAFRYRLRRRPLAGRRRE